MRVTAVVVAALAISLLSGCVTPAGYAHLKNRKSNILTFDVSSVPADATVTVKPLASAPRSHPRIITMRGITRDGRGVLREYEMKTPCQVSIVGEIEHLSYQIRISKEGYQDSIVERSPIFEEGFVKLEDKPIHAVLKPIGFSPPSPVSTPSQPFTPPSVSPSPPPAPTPQPTQETKPTLVEGKNPLRVDRWKYDQEAQTAEFEFTIVSEGTEDMFALRSWALQEIRKVCYEEYAQANHGLGKNMLGFTLVTELNRPKFLVNVTVHRVQPMNHSYDSRTRTGTLKVNIGKQGDANYAGAYKWALANIDTIVSSKEIAMEAGQPPPPGAQYIILSEKTDADGMLEIKFEVIQ